MTDEELYVMFSGGKVSIGMDKIPKIRKYYFQLEQSEGFDLNENPGVDLPPASIMKVDCCSKCYPQNYDKYMTLSQYAIDETYNQDKKTEFKVLEVHSVNWTYSGGESFLMTFTAAEDAAGGSDRAASKKTFQARVCTWYTYGKPEEKFRRVGSCRVKG